MICEIPGLEFRVLGKRCLGCLTPFYLSTGCEISPKTKSLIQQATKKDVIVPSSKL
jgi:hypothetical protein